MQTSSPWNMAGVSPWTKGRGPGPDLTGYDCLFPLSTSSLILLSLTSSIILGHPPLPPFNKKREETTQIVYGEGSVRHAVARRSSGMLGALLPQWKKGKTRATAGMQMRVAVPHTGGGGFGAYSNRRQKDAPPHCASADAGLCQGSQKARCAAMEPSKTPPPLPLARTSSHLAQAPQNVLSRSFFCSAAMALRQSCSRTTW